MTGTNETATETGISTVGTLLAHALRIEEDAEERYTMLADQMEVHNDPALATLFRKFAGHEAHHAAEIRERMAGMVIPEFQPWQFDWGADESPEAVDFTAVRQGMTARAALDLALKAEQQALDFFRRISAAAGDDELRRWADEFAGEEAEHVRLVEGEIARLPAGEDAPGEDPDPPVEPS